MIYRDSASPVKEENNGEYVGEWVQDKRHGRGRMTWESGLVYSGFFRDGYRHNVHGTMTFPNGDTYVGQWAANKMHGAGTLTLKEMGVAFTGEFDQGAPAGDGQLEYTAEDKRYKGSVKDFRPHGYGKMVYPDGAVYDGEFRDGVR
jgi:hypothetical protein